MLNIGFSTTVTIPMASYVLMHNYMYVHPQQCGNLMYVHCECVQCYIELNFIFITTTLSAIQVHPQHFGNLICAYIPFHSAFLFAQFSGICMSVQENYIYYSKKFNVVTVGFVVKSETIPPSYYAYLWIRPWA